MQENFKEWLRKKYEDDESKLRKAWNDNKANFENAAIPSRKERKVFSLCGNFRLPGKDQKTIDYLSCLNDAMVDRAIYFGATIKRATGGQALTGLFWGYVTGGNPTFGKALYSRLINSKEIDFWTAPPHYMNRGLGNHALLHSCVASMRLHDKIWFNESDLRTNLASKWQKENVDGPDNAEGTCELFKREFGHILCNNAYGFWFEMENGWYKDKKILDFFKRSQGISAWSSSLEKRSNSEIAVIIDDMSQLYDSAAIRETLLREERIHELCRIGAMPDFYFLSDISRMPAEQYKMIVFLNCFALDRKTRGQINKLKNQNRTLAWVFAPGIINPENTDGKLNLEGMEKLCGFKFACNKDKSVSLATKIIDNDYLKTLKADYEFGRYYRDIESGICGGPKRKRRVPNLNIRFSVKDEKAIALGVYSDNKDEIALAAKKFKNWNSIFIGSIYPSSLIWRAIAKKAKVHLYSDNPSDIVYHNGNFLCLHVSSAGERTISLPEKTGAYELFTDKKTGENIDSFKVDLPEKSTRFFYTGSLEKIKSWKKNNE
jgi:hypothetical protein